MKILKSLHFAALAIPVALTACHPVPHQEQPEPAVQQPEVPEPEPQEQAALSAIPEPDAPRKSYKYYFPDPEPQQEEAQEPTAVLAFLYKPVRPQQTEPAEEQEKVPEVEPPQEPPSAEPEPPPTPAAQKEDEEYLRSTTDVNVSRDVFADDKQRILQIISEMEVIMQNRDYGKWLKYITPASAAYYQNQRNLARASERLPYKGMTMKNLQDYFRLVFIPARKGRIVDEIRYISEDYVKAVQVQNSEDIVYYYFRKANGSWMIDLPPLD